MTRGHARPAIALFAATLACGPLTGGAGSGIPGRVDLGADRVVLRPFARITGVAVTQRFAFVSSEYGVATFDRLLHSWMPQVGEPEPGPSRRVLGIAAHPLDDAVWIIEPGALVYFEPTLGWSLRTTVVGMIDAVLFDRRDPHAGIWVRSLGRWIRVPPTGAAVPVSVQELPSPEARISPMTLEELARRRPALRSFARLLTRDPSMRSWEPSAGDEAPDGDEVWLGTWGYGVFRVDPEFVRATHEPYGLLEQGAGALAASEDGVWIAGAGDPRASAAGLVFASADLRDWIWQTPGIAGGLEGARARALAVRGGRAWVGTDRGALRLELDGPPRARPLTSARGLPSDDVLALLPRLDGLWIGTSRGLVFVRERGDAERGATQDMPEIVGEVLIAGTAVRDLAAIGDTLWIATDAGLLLLAPDAPRRPARIATAASDARLSRRMLELAMSDTVVALATDTDILLVHSRTGTVLDTPAAAGVRVVGGPTALEMDARTIWLGGPRGVLVVDRESGASRVLGVPGDVPGRVNDIALSELFAWIATEDGVLRLRRDPGGMPR